MSSTPPSYGVTAAVVILFALLFGSAFIALYLFLRRRRLASRRSPLPTHSPVSPASDGTQETPLQKWTCTLRSWGRKAPQRSFMYGRKNSVDDRRTESMFRKNDEWLDRIRHLVEEAKHAPEPQPTPSPKSLLTALCTPKSGARQRSNTVSPLLNALDTLTSRCTPRARSLSEASMLGPRPAEETAPPTSTFQMAHDWEVEQARLTDRMLQSGVPMAWKAYVPPQASPASPVPPLDCRWASSTPVSGLGISSDKPLPAASIGMSRPLP
ncbi:hypothetical protein PsYK624_103200 [Phanerochaete sordida]|uniref:Uncharacterized protein n=1 Tax=Phanerochaete sordida TaxID=48140 RepID=A0A9P3LHH8_9APHY|nr:hypothetical protein PsYK624_103200 [Phanerochaete sordida]